MKIKCPQCASVNQIDSIDYSDTDTEIQCGRCSEMLQITGALMPGRVLGEYVIKEELRDHMNETDFLAEQTSLNRIVVLKVLKQYAGLQEYYINKFLEINRQLGNIHHAGLTSVYAVGRESDGIYYCAREQFGTTLMDNLVDYGVMPVEEAISILVDLVGALNEAWKQNQIIHQNIKPENILVANGRGKLIDLGMASLKSEKNGEKISGTPQYLSPERIDGKEADIKSDIYSLGVTLYLMVTGSLPFDADNTDQVLQNHLKGRYKPANEENPDLGEDTSLVIDMLLEIEHDNRYVNLDELLQDLNAVLNGNIPKYAFENKERKADETEEILKEERVDQPVVLRKKRKKGVEYSDVGQKTMVASTADVKKGEPLKIISDAPNENQPIEALPDEEAPAEAEEAPAEAEEVPAEAEEASAETEEAPADAEEAPAKAEEAPAKAEKEPAAASDADGEPKKKKNPTKIKMKKPLMKSKSKNKTKTGISNKFKMNKRPKPSVSDPEE